MDATKIRHLFDLYYSGDITPEEYESLLSFLKEARDLTPELEAERRMLMAIDACEAVMPDNFEVRLHTVIDRKAKRLRMFKRVAIYSSAAAVLLICLATGIHFSHQVTLQPESVAESVDNSQLIYIAQNTARKKSTDSHIIDGLPQTLATAQPNMASQADEASQARVVSQNKVTTVRKKRVPVKVKQAVSETLTDEDMEEAAKIIDAALINALSGLRGKQDKVVESIDNIKINQITL